MTGEWSLRRNQQETDMNTQIDLLSDDTLDAVTGGLDMNPATNPGHYAGQTKLPPAPAAAPGTQGNGGNYTGIWIWGVAAAAVVCAFP
jgi:hypothetical protein